MQTVPRERFVMPGRENLAYIDQDLLLCEEPERRFMLSPMILGRLIQALEIEPGMKVLDVASGFGYSAAVLAELGARVTALEIGEIPGRCGARAPCGGRRDCGRGRARPARSGLEAQRALRCGSRERGRRGAARRVCCGQLAEGGRLVCVQGRGRSAKATLYVRAGEAYGQRSVFDAAAPLLPQFRAEQGFVF